jgi:hypothetical protein
LVNGSIMIKLQEKAQFHETNSTMLFPAHDGNHSLEKKHNFFC